MVDPVERATLQSCSSEALITTPLARYVSGHQVDHHAASLHPLALSYSDLSVWCFVCDSYVDHELLFEVKDRAHQDKFGEPMLKPDYGKVEEGATFQMI